jgi:DNA-binding LacI/PurR family transcriptional regulator
MAVTIKQVAKKAGVSVGTVSRVINRRPDVNPDLRLHVERVILDLQYRPNARAQSFGRNSSPILSFILSNRTFTHPFHSHVLQGVEEHCEEAGFFVLFTKFNYSQETKVDALRLPSILQSHGIADCLILAGTNYGNFVEALDRMAMRYVTLANNLITSRPLPPRDGVRFDEVGGAIEATSYLIELGHRNIWFIGDTSLPWFKRRFDGYVKAMRAAGLKPQSLPGRLSDDQFTDGLNSVDVILSQKYPVSGLVCGSDDVAYGAWEALRRGGLEVPGDVSLIGFDDQYGPLRLPHLTSVRVQTEEVGRELARMAIEKLKPGVRYLPEVMIETKLERRGTCRPLLGLKRTRNSDRIS